LGWTCLKLWAAACWKVSWNVDPLPLSVPERAALLLPDEAEALPEEDPPPPDDEQAATNEAIATVDNPTVAARWMR
jgi:hypothetical protein